MNLLWRFVQSQLATRRVGAAWALCVGLAGTAIFSEEVASSYPVQDWLFWSMAKLWLWLALFSAGCLCFGQFVLVRLLRLDKLTALESAALSMTTGTIGFVMGMYLGGAFGVFNATFAVALPSAMLVLCGYDGALLLRRFKAELYEARYTWLSWVVTGYGLLLVGLVYLGAMTPETICTDATMVHMRIAQEYTRAGRIVPFASLWVGTVPHLASILFTWGFIVPGLSAAQHWMLAVHLEFCLFLWTLVGVAALVQRTVGDFRIRAGWVSVLLFPGLFAYDSNISGAADHVLAFYSVAVALTTLLVCKDFSKGACVLLGFALAGVLLTKYQAVYLVAPTAFVVAMAWLGRCYRELRAARSMFSRDLKWAPLIVIATTCLLVSPHFIKNIIFYRNPVYPFFQRVFTDSTPQIPNAWLYVAHLYQDMSRVPTGSLLDKLQHAVGLFFTFSFKPHYFSRDVPYFGSLFTLLLPGILFLPNRRNTVRVLIIGGGALLLWGMTFNVDRNLQTFMPVLAAATGALIIKMWNLGWVARMGLIPLIGFQVVWGGDLPVFDSRGSRIKAAMDLIATGHENKAKTRFDEYRRSYVAMGEATPRDARLLFHLAYDALGVDRDIVLDRPGFQGLVSYDTVHNPRELFDYYRSLGITHVVLDSRESNPSAQQPEILLRTLIRRYASSVGGFGAYQLFKLPKVAPPAERAYQVVALGVSGYAAGLYPIEHLGTVEYLGGEVKKYSEPDHKATPENLESLLARADAVLMRRDYALSAQSRSSMLAQFESIDSWGGDATLYVRRR